MLNKEILFILKKVSNLMRTVLVFSTTVDTNLEVGIIKVKFLNPYSEFFNITQIE